MSSIILKRSVECAVSITRIQSGVAQLCVPFLGFIVLTTFNSCLPTERLYYIIFFIICQVFFKISFFKIKFQIQNDKSNNGDISSHYVLLFLIMHHHSFYMTLVSNAYKFQIEKRIHHDSMNNPYLNNYYMISNYCSYFFLLFQPLNNCQFCIRKLTTIFEH